MFISYDGVYCLGKFKEWIFISLVQNQLNGLNVIREKVCFLVVFNDDVVCLGYLYSRIGFNLGLF